MYCLLLSNESRAWYACSLCFRGRTEGEGEEGVAGEDLYPSLMCPGAFGTVRSFTCPFPSTGIWHCRNTPSDLAISLNLQTCKNAQHEINLEIHDWPINPELTAIP